MVETKNILIIISGSIAAYKSLELIRLLRKENIGVSVILTKGGAEFITPLSVSSLTERPTYGDLFSLKDEVEMGHIRLSREADLVLVAPASADLIAKMANGLADDLASTTLLASDAPIYVAPTMNTQMWNHPATKRNLERIGRDGARLIEPGSGELACGETGAGRMAEPEQILKTIQDALTQAPKKKLEPLPLEDKSVLITAGPTHEPIDPVRFLGNHSSGKQGYAIAGTLAEAGADVTLVSGPTGLPCPPGVRRINTTTAQEMHDACMEGLPVDIAVCTAAVADWGVAEPSETKLKKRVNQSAPTLSLKENPDILATIAKHPTHRPELVIGFAAETDNIEQNATEKRARKACDWLLANDTSKGKVFGEDHNQILFITSEEATLWPKMSKLEVAYRLVNCITEHLSKHSINKGAA